MFTKIVQIAVPFIWFGVIGAISFLETPLKFQAPGIDLPLGLGIGRLVFFAMNKVEIVLAVIFLITLRRERTALSAAFKYFLPVLAILVLDTLWLLPALDARAEQVIAGIAAPHSDLHIFYVVLEAAKFVLILILGIAVAKRHLSSNGYEK